ncbi:PsbP-related protein [Brevibacillus sp. H7]|uniref:PsbP-related protein n=1 Tax=Brevibacillus sp. H7 TaxID=3349138 RepID=UPI00382B3E83
MHIGFCFIYPKEWSIATESLGAVAIFLSQKESESDGFQENVSIGLQDLENNEFKTLDQYVDSNIRGLEKFVTNYELVETKDLVISNIPAKQIIYTGDQGIYRIKFLQTYFIKDNVAYIISYTADQEKFDKYLKLAENVITSFQPL